MLVELVEDVGPEVVTVGGVLLAGGTAGSARFGGGDRNDAQEVCNQQIQYSNCLR